MTMTNTKNRAVYSLMAKLFWLQKIIDRDHVEQKKYENCS